MTSNFLVNVYGTNTDVLSIINSKTVTTVEILTQNPPNQKYNVTFNRKVAIRTADITVGLNGYCLNGEQKYTFGPAQPPLWVAVSEIGATAGNTISFSTNGITWNGLGYSIFGLNTAGCGICHNGRIWVAVGQTISAYSWDGKIWTVIPGLLGWCVAWNGTMFVCGDYIATSKVYYSYDGINWIQTTGLSFCRTIMWNGSIWVAATSSNGIRYSQDGINWTVSGSSLSVFTGGAVYGVAWNGIAWVAVGRVANTIAYSTDAITWNSVPLSRNYISTGFTVSWNGTVWVAAGQSSNVIAYTTDPTGQSSWLKITTIMNERIMNIKWNGKYFVAIGNGATNDLGYSLNGINWIGLGSSVITGTVNGGGIEYNSLRPHSITIPRYMVFAGGQLSGSTSLSYSYDGLTWTGIGGSIFGFCFSIQYNGKIWIAVGSGNNSIAYSYNGITWNGLGPSVVRMPTCFGVVWNGTIWVAVGYGDTGNVGNSIAVSYDGIMWKGVVPFAISSSLSNGFREIAWNGSYFITVSGGGSAFGLSSNNLIKYSTDGIIWRPVNQSIFSAIRGICTNGTIWVAVGYGISIGYSYNGTSWTGVSSIFTTYGWKVAWNGTMFIAVGAGTNCAAYSYNGVNWTGLGSTPFAAASGAFAIAWDGTRWQMGGTSSTNAYSYNGINWTTYASGFSNGRCFASNYNAPPNVYIQHPTVAVGTGNNTIAYSEDGITWRGLGQDIFDGEGYDVAWNGSLWVAVGLGSVNTIAYSQDGVKWTGLGKTIFSTSGNGIGWNGTYWVATGSGTNTIAYSQYGMIWFGLGSSVFTQSGSGVGWNGTAWVATGQGTNTLAYSFDSINWTGIGSTTFSTLGYAVATNGIYWVATGQGSNCMAYTTDITGATGWTAITGVFDTTGFVGSAYGIAWNGSTWVVVGRPAGLSTTEIAYSTNATSWTGVSNNPFSISGLGVCWNGVRFVASGYGGNSIAYSPDGITWYRGFNGLSSGSTGNIFTAYGNAVASNPGVGAVPIQSQMVLNTNVNGQSALDIVAPAYYQPGYSGISVKIEQNNLY